MESYPVGPGSAVPSPEWNSSPQIHNRSQITSAVRAGLIALVLLAVLAIIVLF